MGMAQYAVSFLLTLLVMSVIALAILIFNLLFPKAFPAKLRYAVWLVVLVGLLIPFRPVIGNGLITVPIPAAAGAQVGVTQSAGLGTSPETAPAQDITEVETAENTPAGWSISPATVCVLVWGIVAVLIFAWHIWRYIRFIRTIRRWGVEVKDKNTLSILRSVQVESGVDYKKIGLKVCGFVSSSMLTGFWRPVILLPEKYFEADELKLIFRHELIHYKRRDLLVKLLSVIAVSIYWFNPIVYWLCAAMQTDGEASCDEAVLLDADKENRQFYAEVIIGMIGGRNTAGTLLSTCFYGGKSSIKRRLDSIMDTTRKIKKPAIAALLVVMALTVFSGSVFALSIQEPPDAVTPPIIPEVTTTDSGTITAARAKEIALATVGGGTVTDCILEGEREVYKATVLYGDKKYGMDIDAASGAVTNYRLETIEAATSPASPETQAPSDTPAPASADPPSSTTTPATTDTPPPATATPPSSGSQSTPSPSTPSSNSEITTERAKEIALTKVGGGTVTECKLDYENGRKVCEIKIVYGNTKYEMDVDAITGAISDYSAEAIKGSSDDDHDD